MSAPTASENIDTCPWCGKSNQGYKLVVDFTIIDSFREKTWEEIELQCGCRVAGAEVHDDFVSANVRETWIYDPISDKTVLTWLDKVD